MKILHPLNYQAPISSGFGWRNLGSGSHFHAALDIAAPVGTWVRASLPGKVIKVNATNSAGYADGYDSVEAGVNGSNVEIDHGNGFFTRYAHLSNSNVSVGQKVNVGQWIGRVGTKGTGAHLHFEFKGNPGYYGGDFSKAYDPEPLFTFNLNEVGGSSKGWLGGVAAIVALTGVGVAAYYNFDGKKIKQDFKKLAA